MIATNAGVEAHEQMTEDVAAENVQSIRSKPDRTPRDEVPIVLIRRARCKLCGSAKLKTNRSVTDEDGGVTRDCRCLGCGERLFVILE